MAINKVIYGGTTLIDLSGDSLASANQLMQGVTAHDRTGALITGTATGGGSAPLVVGALRPDAELVHSWTYDRYIVQDEGVTIPSYSTSVKTLKASETLASGIAHDFSTYNYFFVCKGLATPVYSNEVPLYGRQYYGMKLSRGELYALSPSEAIDSMKYSSKKIIPTGTVNTVIHVYNDSSAERVNVIGTAYGANFGSEQISMLATNYSMKASSPALRLQGHKTYFSSAVWACLEDVRYQYILELWRSPKGNLNIDGFNFYSLFKHVSDCYKGDGTLT